MAIVPVRRLWLAVLLGYLTMGAALQALPAWAASRFGSTPGAIGVTVAATGFSAMLARPWAGRWADHRGPRSIVVAGAALSTAGALLHLLAPSPIVLLAGRLLLGAGEGAVFTGAITWVTRGTPATRSGAVIGWFGLSMWSGLAAGPPLAAWAASQVGLPAVWVAATLLPAAGLLLTLLTPRSTVTTHAGTAPLGPLLPAAARRPGLILGLASFGYGILAAFLVTRMQRQGLPGSSWALTLFAAAFLVTRLLGSPLIDVAGATAVGTVSVLIEAVGLTILAPATSTASVLLGATLTGAGVALIYPATATLLLAALDDGPRGGAIGAMTSAWDAGLAAAGPAGAAALSLGGYPAVFALGVLACLLAATSLTYRATPTDRSPRRCRRSARTASNTGNAGLGPASASGTTR